MVSINGTQGTSKAQIIQQNNNNSSTSKTSDSTSVITTKSINGDTFSTSGSESQYADQYEFDDANFDTYYDKIEVLQNKDNPKDLTKAEIKTIYKDIKAGLSLASKFPESDTYGIILEFLNENPDVNALADEMTADLPSDSDGIAGWDDDGEVRNAEVKKYDKKHKKDTKKMNSFSNLLTQEEVKQYLTGKMSKADFKKFLKDFNEINNTKFKVDDFSKKNLQKMYNMATKAYDKSSENWSDSKYCDAATGLMDAFEELGIINDKGKVELAKKK